MQITTEPFVNSTDFVNSTTNYTAHDEDNSEPYWLIGIGIFVFFCLMGSCGRNTGSNHRPRAPPQNTQHPASTQTHTMSGFTQITPPTNETSPTTPPSDESTSTTPPSDESPSDESTSTTPPSDESTSTTSYADGSSSTTADESASSTPPIIEFTSSPAPAAIYILGMEGGDTYQDDSVSPTTPPPSYDSIMNHPFVPPPSYDDTVGE